MALQLDDEKDPNALPPVKPKPVPATPTPLGTALPLAPAASTPTTMPATPSPSLPIAQAPTTMPATPAPVAPPTGFGAAGTGQGTDGPLGRSYGSPFGAGAAAAAAAANSNYSASDMVRPGSPFYHGTPGQLAWGAANPAGGASAMTPATPPASPAPSLPIAPPPIAPAYGGSPGAGGSYMGTPDTMAYRDSEFGQSQINSGTAQNLAAMSRGASPTASVGPPPVATADNWQNQDANIAGYQQNLEARSATAGLADINNGYNPWETQDELNARRGLTANPVTGAFDRADERGIPIAGDTTYNSSGGNITSQNLNGTGLTGPDGRPLAPGLTEFGGSANPLDQLGARGAGAPEQTLTAGSTWTPQGGEVPNGALPSAGGASTLPFSAPPSAAPSVGEGLPLAGAPSNPAGVDRSALASSMFDTLAKSSDPWYQKAKRDVFSQKAGMGQLGSGMLRTSLGDAQNNREIQLDTFRRGVLDNAVEGSINDSFRTADNARADQGQAFDQGAREIALDEALRQGDFDRYYRLLSAGEAGNPSGTALTLAGNYGDQATSAGQAAGDLLSGAAQSSANRPTGSAPAETGGVPNEIPDWLQQYLDAQQPGYSNVGQPSLPIGLPTGPIVQPKYPGAPNANEWVQ